MSLKMRSQRGHDDGTVKPTSINHASVVSFCCCHVFGCCLNTDMCRSAPEALICDHQACHSLWFSMLSPLCVTLMCSERSCRRPTLTTFPSILIKQCANVVFILPFQIVVPFIITEIDSTRCHCLREESASKLSQIQREKNIRLVCSPNGRRHQTPVQRLQPARPTQGRKPASADLPVIASLDHLFASGCRRRNSMSVPCDSKCTRPNQQHRRCA